MSERPSAAQVIEAIDRADLLPLADWLDSGQPIDEDMAALLSIAIRAGMVVPAQRVTLQGVDRRDDRDRQIWAYVHVRMLRLPRGSRKRIFALAAARFLMSEPSIKLAYDTGEKEYSDPEGFVLLQMFYWPKAVREYCEENGADLQSELSRLWSVNNANPN